MSTVGVVGAGSWGTALAKILAENGFEVTLWCHGEDTYKALLRSRENPVYLPGVILPPPVRVVHDVTEAIVSHDFVVLACPSHTLRETLGGALGGLSRTSIVLSAVKGFEGSSFKVVTDFILELMPPGCQTQVAALSGPTFATEVARGLPAAATVAAKSRHTAEEVQRLLSTCRFRLYASDDLVGTQVGGAVKNVIAIACGVSDGLGLGLSARSALITRGLAEMVRLAVHLGGNPMTLQGLPGVGDLVLTCTGELSRNKAIGRKIGMGVTPADAVQGSRMVVEGLRGAAILRSMARERGLEMPIVEVVCQILFDGLSPSLAVERLLNRPLRHELDTKT